MSEIKNLDPQIVWKNFYELTRVPRPSGHLHKIQDYLLGWAKEHHIEAFKDNGENIVMRKQASQGMENRKTVVLQAPDSTFIDGTVTDSTGSFLFRQGIKPCRLIFQHLLYKSLVKEYDATGDVGEVVLESQDYALGEVVVSAERPLVKVENGTLNYDLEALAEKTTAGNAYEAITRLPGVLEQGGSLSLIGAGSATVILNGRPSSMTSEQLASLLKSTPVSHVEKAEVMYSAPARYRVKGAVINIILKKQKTDASSIRGEVGAGFTQGSYAQGNGRANLSEPFFHEPEGDGRRTLCGRLRQTADGLRLHLPPHAGRQSV